MTWWRRVLSRPRLERELDAELRDHLDRQLAELVASGMEPEEAKRRAHLALGGIEQVKERCRDARGTRWLEQLVQDVRYGGRMLRKGPVFTLVAVLSLGLGIGANTAIFSLVNGLLLRTLPVREPDRLVLLSRGSWTNPTWEEIRAHQWEFAGGAAAFSGDSFDLASGGQTDTVQGLWVSGGFFDLLGIRPMLGRALTTSDDRHGGGEAGPVAVISHSFWQRRLGGAPDVIGRPLTLNRVSFTIVGITPRSFQGPVIGRSFDVFVPIGAVDLLDVQHLHSRLRGRSFRWLDIMLRLKPGQSVDDLSRAVNARRPQIREATMPQDWPSHMLGRFLGEEFTVTPAARGPEGVREQFQRPLLAVMAIVGLVLLIAAANLANLLQARATARRAELTMRRALGASRSRIARQLLTESFLLSAMGVVVGLVLAHWGVRLLVAQLARWDDGVFIDVTMEWRILAFTGALGIGTALLFGTAPAYRASKVDPTSVLKDKGRTLIGGRWRKSGGWLVVCQVALSLVLIVAAGLFVRTLTALAARDLGFDADRVLLVTIEGTGTTNLSPQESNDRYIRMADMIMALPGVAAAGASYIDPLGGNGWSDRFEIPGAPELSESESLVLMNGVTPGWFATYGTTLLAGRDFDATDRSGAPPVLIVNEAFVRRFMNGQHPIGRVVRGRMLSSSGGELVQIVGVVEDAVYSSLRDPVPPTAYVPMAQVPRPWPSETLAVRSTRGDPSALTKDVANAMTRIDPTLSLTVRTLAHQVGSELVRERMVAMLAGFFGGLALLLSAIGLYGVTAYTVSRRRAEIALRMALGADGSAVTRLVLTRLVVLVLLGVGIGAALSAWASGFAASLLYGLQPRDPATFVAAAVVLASIAVLSAWLPTRQATRIDPAQVLREG